jgi:hypothetical protein
MSDYYPEDLIDLIQNSIPDESVVITDLDTGEVVYEQGEN